MATSLTPQLVPWALALSLMVALGLHLAPAVSASTPTQYEASRSLSSWTTGSATLFGGPQEGYDYAFNATVPPGSCGFGELDTSLWPFYGLVGISPKSVLATARPTSGCGTCLEVKCVDTRPKACNSFQGRPVSLTAMVFDSCPSCNATQLNLHHLAFQKIARTRFGNVQIAYKQVPCQPPEGISVKVDPWRTNNGSWMRIVFGNLAGDGGLVTVAIRPSPAPLDLNPQQGTATDAGDDKGWSAMNNTFGGVWEIVGLSPSAPFGYDLRLTDAVSGSTLIRNAIPAYTSANVALHTFVFPNQLPAGPTLADVLASQPLPNTSTTLTTKLDVTHNPGPTASTAANPNLRRLLSDGSRKATSTPPNSGGSGDDGAKPCAPKPPNAHHKPQQHKEDKKPCASPADKPHSKPHSKPAPSPKQHGGPGPKPCDSPAPVPAPTPSPSPSPSPSSVSGKPGRRPVPAPPPPPVRAKLIIPEDVKKWLDDNHVQAGGDPSSLLDAVPDAAPGHTAIGHLGPGTGGTGSWPKGVAAAAAATNTKAGGTASKGSPSKEQ